jgi:crotonobetainyl-CoA:carnitine CoA-transferase CaiB-like acyl-CoA transferase
MSGPLAGVRVLEMATTISGPYAAMLLGDLGAEVVKVEAPAGGDPFRRWGGHGAEVRPQFAAYNRGKKSVCLDVKDPDGREAFKRLAAASDVLIENFRPGTMDRLGIGYEDLRPENPRLVYCSISGMGQTGPFARRPSYESVSLALSGLWSRLVDLRKPRPLGPNLADQLTSLYAVYGTLAALHHAARTGQGQRVEVSMLLANMAFLAEPIANFFAIGEVGDLDTRAKRSQAYALLARDGLPLAIHLSSVPKFWEGLTRAIDRPELAADDRFATNADRVRNYDVLNAILDETFAVRDRDDWLARLEQADVPAAPIRSIAEAIASPEAASLDAIRQYGRGKRAVRLVRCPVDFSATPAGGELPPPDLGEHTQELLEGGPRVTDSVADPGERPSARPDPQRSPRSASTR